MRDRAGDAILLARFFMGRFNLEFNRTLRGFSDDALSALAAHSWPGNVRELENRVKRAVVMADGRQIEDEDLELAASEQQENLDLRAARMRAERNVILKALARSNGTLATAAKLLGISRPTLYTLLEAHGLELEAGVRADMPDHPPDAA